MPFIGRAILMLLLGLVPVSQATGQDLVDVIALERQILLSFRDGEFATATALIEKYLEERPNDQGMLYNAACAQAQLGELDEAASYLFRAVKAGFRDFEHMQSDPDLAPVRRHPTYLAILEARERVSRNAAQEMFSQWRQTYGERGYRYEVDESRRLLYATALDRVSHAQMRGMLERQADQLIETMFDAPPDYYVLVAVPTAGDARRIFDEDRVGGIYEHNQRRLISRDIGGSLRHEFFHLMHYGHMERLNQPHPLWIQEGLASLYEDYEFDERGRIAFIANERRNVAKRLSRANRITHWKDLFQMPAQQFMDDASRLYPQVRAIFEFVAEQGKLSDWYATYVARFDEDASGALAMQTVFGMPLDDIERQWRAWLAGKPLLNTQIDPGEAGLGIVVEVRSGNDGVLIDEVLPGSAAAAAGLLPGDVIVAVNGKATRSGTELTNLIGSMRVGDDVTVRVRRDGRYQTARLRLRPVSTP